MSTYTKINIRINPQNPGVVVNTNNLTATEINKKNSLFGTQIPEKDKSQRRTQKNSQQRKQNQTVSTKPNKSRYQASPQEVAEAERERDMYMKELRDNKATTGMIYTSTQLLKQQNELIHQNQKIMHQLINENKNGKSGNQGVKDSKGNNNKLQKQQLRQATDSVNNQIEEIRKMRDEIVRAGREIQENLQDIRSGKVQMPNNITEMNQNLRNKVDTSIRNIDLLSPDKFDLVNRFQNFNIEAYSQKLAQLKKEINNMQRQSQNVEKELKTRVNNLEKIRIQPQFETQLLEPYQNDIKKRLGAIDLTEAKSRVFSKLGDFDYFQLASEVTDIGIQIQQEIDQFEFVCKQFQIQVPLLKFDNKEIKALELKLPSILDEFKESRGIDFKQNKNKNTLNEKEIAYSLKQQSIQNKKNPNQNKPPAVPSKPKDLSNQIQYKRMGENAFKTIMQKKPIPHQQSKKQVQSNRIIEPVHPKKQQNEQDFQDYLNNIKNQQLEHLYKKKRDDLIRMKEQLYDESTEPFEPVTKITYPRRQEDKIHIDTHQNNNSPKKVNPNPNQNQTQNRINQSDYKEQDSIGSRMFDPNPGAIKQIGRQVLKQKLKDLIGKQKKPNTFDSDNPKQIFVPSQANNQPQMQPQMGAATINSFAEGFLSVINNTFAQMNRGISNSLSKRKPGPPAPRNQSQQPRHKIPFPTLQQIPKPPVFNLKFQPIYRQPGPQFTFSSFPKKETIPPTQTNNVERRDYNDYDDADSEIGYRNYLDQSRSQAKSDISKIDLDRSQI